MAFWSLYKFISSYVQTYYLISLYITTYKFVFSHLGSGVARKSPMLGHGMSTLHLYELPREVQKLLEGSGGILPQKI